jgi:pyridoxal/pyridoxine/pyridoxamine kinase
MDPGTAMLIATAVASAAKGTGDVLSSQNAKKQAKRRSKETERETHANLIQEALQRSAELESHRLASRQKTGKRRASISNDTSELVRGALTI